MIQPGLERIGRLLKGVEFPWKAIHVAGTNGKGSICHYASHLLARREVKTGTFTSPHVVNRWDGIKINNKPVSEELFREIEAHYARLNQRERIGASAFEILTATAFHIFNEVDVKVGVVEVGMGGKLDATNILNNQAVSVISRIARDHEGFLGNTLEQIAEHKAGILRPNTPYIVNPVNEWNIQEVIDRYASKIGAGPRIATDSVELRKNLYSRKVWHRFAADLLPFQRDNAVLGMKAAQEAVKSLGHEMSSENAAEMMCLDQKRQHQGRLEWLTVPPIFGTERSEGRPILVDGAHNPDAAIVLQDFIQKKVRYQRTVAHGKPPKSGWPVTWVLAMTEGKDARQYLAKLLQLGDNVITTSFGPVEGMPWVKPMDPNELLNIAKLAEPGITGLDLRRGGVLQALCAARYMAMLTQPIVLTGSLYLVGDLHRELRSRQDKRWWTDPQQAEDRANFVARLDHAKRRVYTVLSNTKSVLSDEKALEIDNKETERRSVMEKMIEMQDELDALDNELLHLDAEQQRILDGRSFASKMSLHDDDSVESSQLVSVPPAAKLTSTNPSKADEINLSKEDGIGQRKQDETGLSNEDEAEKSTGQPGTVEQAPIGPPIRKFIFFDPKDKGRRKSLKSTSTDPSKEEETEKSTSQLRIIKHTQNGLPIRKFMSLDPKDKHLRRSFGNIGD